MKDEIIIWFQDGILNPYYLGCHIFSATGDKTQSLTIELPLNTDFIQSSEIVNFLSAIGVEEMRKMIPAINPCADTISIAVSGEVLRMPSFWNAIVVRFHTDQNIPLIAYVLVSFFHEKILWAQPNFIYEGLGSYKGDGGNSPLAFTSSPNDSLWIAQRQDRLKHTYNGDAWVDTAWTLTKGDPRIRIGVVDQAFDYRHPDLGGGEGDSFRVRGAWNYQSPKAMKDTWSDGGLKATSHGTSCLSIIGAISNNTIGVAGICGGDDTITTGTSMYCFAASNSGAVSNAVWEASANTGNLPVLGGSGKLWMCDILSFSISTKNKYGSDPRGFGLKDEIVRAIIAFRYQNGRTTFAAMGDGRSNHVILDADTTYTGSPQDVDKEWIIAVSSTEMLNVKNTEDYGMNLDLLASGSVAACAVTGNPGSPVYTYLQFTQASVAAPVAAGIGGLLLSLHKNLIDSNSRNDTIPPFLYPDDIEWLLKHSALQRSGSSGHNDSTGWGVVKAYPTLEKLLYPYVLKHDSVRCVYEDAPHYEEDMLKIVFPGWTSDSSYQPVQGGNDTYRVKRYRLSRQIQIDKGRLGLNNATIERVWGRGGNGYTGYGNPLKLKNLPYRLPLYRVGYCAVVGDTAFSQDYCELETYVYKVFKIDQSGQVYDSLWIPHQPDSAYFTYTILARKQIPNAVHEEPLAKKFSFDVFPNPVSGAVHFSFHNEEYGLIMIKIYDVLGREIGAGNSLAASLDPGSHVHSWDAGELNSGMYFIRAQFKDQAPIVKKLIIRR